MRVAAKLLRVFIALLLIYCLFVVLLSSVAGFATQTPLMETKFLRFADVQITGLEQGAYPPLAESITGFLQGRLDSPQLTVKRAGMQSEAFSAREIAHLADIRELLKTVQVMRYTAIALVGLALLAYFILRKANPALLKAFRLERSLIMGMLAFFGLVAFLLIWGLIDFNGLFTAAHHVVFRNDLWLLDPQRDLLLQLMPLELFVSYGWDLLRENAFLLLILPLAAFGLRGSVKRVKT